MLVAVMIMWYSEGSIYISIYKGGCVFLMITVRLLPHAKFARSDHREDALHFRWQNDFIGGHIWFVVEHQLKLKNDLSLIDE